MEISDIARQFDCYFHDLIEYLIRTYSIYEHNQKRNDEQITLDYEKLTLISIRQLIIKSRKNQLNFITWINNAIPVAMNLTKSDLFLEQRIDEKSYKMFKRKLVESLKKYNLLISQNKNIINDYGISEIDKLINFADKIVAHYSYLELEKWDHTHEIFYNKKMLREIISSIYSIAQSLDMLSNLEGCGEIDYFNRIDFEEWIDKIIKLKPKEVL